MAAQHTTSVTLGVSHAASFDLKVNAVPQAGTAPTNGDSAKLSKSTVKSTVNSFCVPMAAAEVSHA